MEDSSFVHRIERKSREEAAFKIREELISQLSSDDNSVYLPKCQSCCKRPAENYCNRVKCEQYLNEQRYFCSECNNEENDVHNHGPNPIIEFVVNKLVREWQDSLIKASELEEEI